MKVMENASNGKWKSSKMQAMEMLVMEMQVRKMQVIENASNGK